MRQAFASIRPGTGGDELLISVFLMRERALGAASTWAPYVAVLPEHVPLPIDFAEADLAALQVRPRRWGGAPGRMGPRHPRRAG